DPQALSMVEQSLLHMRFGGIYDHVGFGFHRYATDERWRIPHFEKMLYDQALLILAYSEAFQIRQNPIWEQTVRELVHYCERELLAPEGVFYTAEDAESAGEEGAFYLWSDAELRSLLSQDEYDLLCFAFGVDPQGNVPGSRYNHLFQTAPWEALSNHFHVPPMELQQRWDVIRRKLFARRQRRTPPQRDEKVLTDWNGLMVAALAVAARSLGDNHCHTLALHAARWLLEQWHRHGRLFHRYAEGEWAVPALLDDYAFLLWAMVELYATTLDLDFLQAALTLGEQLYERFWDDTAKSFFLSTPEDTELPLRYREDSDGAVPSGAAVACWNFLRLAHITGDPAWRTRAETALANLPVNLSRAPMAFPTFLTALDMALGPTTELCLITPEPTREFWALLHEGHRHFLPRTVLLGAVGNQALERLRTLAPAYSSYPLPSEATAYVCTNGACQPPVATPEQLRTLLPIRPLEG
ncbi:MAG: thioredoxin domain-containing protein, partial [Candidatus Kapabacteria bacterium]|nr:thioredoxin domain-containing protein [Candidatus Kapabacteria bacterium]